MHQPTFFRGDCLDFLPTLPDRSVDLIYADLPYGCTDCAWDVPIPLGQLWREYRRLLAPGGAVVLTATMRFAVDLINSNPKWFRYDLVWSKVASTGFLDARRKPLRAHEHVLVFGPKLPRYNPQMTAGEPYRSERRPECAGIYNTRRGAVTENKGDRYPTSVLTIPNGNSAVPRKVHPTQKPEGLADWVIRTFTDPDGHVLDHCFGSGSAGVVSVRLGRRFTGVELDLEFFEVGKARVEAEYDRHRQRSETVPDVECPPE
jgi:DNA modification methylase